MSKDPEVCPDCGASSVETRVELDEFEFGAPPVPLFATIEVHRCRSCAFEFTSSSAEVARDEAVRDHRRRREQILPPGFVLSTVSLDVPEVIVEGFGWTEKFSGTDRDAVQQQAIAAAWEKRTEFLKLLRSLRPQPSLYEVPPGFEWGPVVDGVQAVIAGPRLLELAGSMRHSLVDGPELKFTLGLAWELHEQLLKTLGAPT